MSLENEVNNRKVLHLMLSLFYQINQELFNEKFQNKGYLLEYYNNSISDEFINANEFYTSFLKKFIINPNTLSSNLNSAISLTLTLFNRVEEDYLKNNNNNNNNNNNKVEDTDNNTKLNSEDNFYVSDNFNNIHSSNGVGLHTDIHSTNGIGLHEVNENSTKDNSFNSDNIIIKNNHSNDTGLNWHENKQDTDDDGFLEDDEVDIDYIQNKTILIEDSNEKLNNKVVDYNNPFNNIEEENINHKEKLETIQEKIENNEINQDNKMSPNSIEEQIFKIEEEKKKELEIKSSHLDLWKNKTSEVATSLSSLFNRKKSNNMIVNEELNSQEDKEPQNSNSDNQKQESDFTDIHSTNRIGLHENNINGDDSNKLNIHKDISLKNNFINTALNIIKNNNEDDVIPELDENISVNFSNNEEDVNDIQEENDIVEFKDLNNNSYLDDENNNLKNLNENDKEIIDSFSQNEININENEISNSNNYDNNEEYYNSKIETLNYDDESYSDLEYIDDLILNFGNNEESEVNINEVGIKDKDDFKVTDNKQDFENSNNQLSYKDGNEIKSHELSESDDAAIEQINDLQNDALNSNNNMIAEQVIELNNENNKQILEKNDIDLSFNDIHFTNGIGLHSNQESDTFENLILDDLILNEKEKFQEDTQEETQEKIYKDTFEIKQEESDGIISTKDNTLSDELNLNFNDIEALSNNSNINENEVQIHENIKIDLQNNEEAIKLNHLNIDFTDIHSTNGIGLHNNIHSSNGVGLHENNVNNKNELSTNMNLINNDMTTDNSNKLNIDSFIFNEPSSIEIDSINMDFLDNNTILVSNDIEFNKEGFQFLLDKIETLERKILELEKR